MEEQLAEVTAHLNALREQANNNNNNNSAGAPNPPQQEQRQVHFQDNQPLFGIVDNDNVENDDDDNEAFEEGQFLLD